MSPGASCSTTESKPETAFRRLCRTNQKFTDMKQNLSFQQVEAFDLNLLQKAFDEGRLFIVPRQESAQDLREKGIRSILDYVSRIDDYTSSDYRSHIRDIWSQMLHDDVLGDLFFYTRYARNRGEVNWYRVTVFVCLLREWQVYRNDVSASDLHCILEGTQKRNGRYTGMNRYLLDRQRYYGLIRKKLQNVQQ